MLIQSSAIDILGMKCGRKTKPAVQEFERSFRRFWFPPVEPSTEAFTTLDLKAARLAPSAPNAVAQLAARFARAAM